MTTTPPPMPEPATCALIQAIQGSEYRLLSDSYEPHTAMFSADQIKARDAQWMERITALEADRKMLREALTQTTRLLGELVAKDAQTYAPYMRVIDAARTALESPK